MPSHPRMDKKKKKKLYGRGTPVQSAPVMQMTYGGGQMGQMRQTCSNCGKQHAGPCLWGQDVCYKCGQPDHMSKGCKNLPLQRQSVTQVSQATVPVSVPMGRGLVYKGKRPMQVQS